MTHHLKVNSKSGISQVSARYQAGIRQVSGRYQAGIRQVSGRYQAGIRQVSGRYTNQLPTSYRCAVNYMFGMHFSEVIFSGS